ncbi:UvrD-helicase domain-containing protein [bacterium]|nr:UvrD-helicase domain-containing protein [bacterium]
MSHLMAQLNPVQQEAVKHKDGPLLILAGAGSGKTRIITYRVAYLIEQGVLPQQILAVTFTNKAAQEMSERVNDLLGISGSTVWVATIHSTCAHILRREVEALELGLTRSFSIIDASDQTSIVRRCMKKLEISSQYCQPSYYTRLFSQRKNCVAETEENPWIEREDRLAMKLDQMWQFYQQNLRESNCVDFDDLLDLTYQLFKRQPQILERYQRRWRYQMIDEFQDINALQYSIIKQLAAGHRNICVVGDDDQSIYRWRGAEIENIFGFDKDFPGTKVIVLDQNYRSSRTIIEAATQVSSKISKRREKHLWTQNRQGSRINVYLAQNEYDEASYCVSTIKDFYHRDQMNWNDFAVLYRTNAQSRIFEEKFMEQSVPYYLVGEVGFYKRREIKDLLAYLTLIIDPSHREALLRIINVPTRAIGQKTIDQLQEYAASHGLPLFSALKDKGFLAEVSARAKQSLIEFTTLIEHGYEKTRKEGSFEALRFLANAIKYKDWINKDNDIQAQSRLENIGQLFSALQNNQERMKGENNLSILQTFLEKAALASEADDYEKRKEKVALMTLHCAKGLEFPVVFIAGLVEGLLPHKLALNDEEAQIDEERRLCYVGITRAQRHLFLTAPAIRHYFGRPESGELSRFVRDIPKQLLNIDQSPGLGHGSPWTKPKMYYPTRPAPTKAPYSAPKAVAVDLPFPLSQSGRTKGERLPYRLGSKVKHPRWGNGMVIQIDGAGERLRVVVSFPGFGRKILLVKMAPLELVEY